MAEAPVGVVYQSIASGVPGSPYYTNFYFGPDESPTSVNALTNAFFAAIAPVLRNGMIITTGSEVFGWDATTQEKFTSTPVAPTTITGTRSVSALPTQTQILISWTTGEYINGRQVRGRTYLGGFTEFSNDDNGNPDGPTVSLVQGAAVGLLSDLNDRGLYINSPKNNLLYQVTGAAVSGMWATQRTRSTRG